LRCMRTTAIHGHRARGPVWRMVRGQSQRRVRVSTHLEVLGEDALRLSELRRGERQARVLELAHVRQALGVLAHLLFVIPPSPLRPGQSVLWCASRHVLDREERCQVYPTPTPSSVTSQGGSHHQHFHLPQATQLVQFECTACIPMGSLKGVPTDGDDGGQHTPTNLLRSGSACGGMNCGVLKVLDGTSVAARV